VYLFKVIQIILLYSLFDGTSNTIIARYEIERIMFYANGVNGTKEASCFAFSWAHGDTKENALFQCHVFRCSIPEAVSLVVLCTYIYF